MRVAQAYYYGNSDQNTILVEEFPVLQCNDDCL